MSKPDPLATLDGHGGGRFSLPFLPTVVTALVLGAASLICREPAPPPAVPAPAAPAASLALRASAPAAPLAFQASAPAAANLPRPPAAIAFAQFPPSFVIPEVRTVASAAAPHPVARVATAGTLRRACTAPRCAEGPPRRPDPFSEAVRPAPVEAEAQVRDGLLPDLALPFAPAARVVGEAATYLRTGAASLGSSVVVLVDGLD